MPRNTSNPDSTSASEPRRMKNGISRRSALKAMAVGALTSRILKADGTEAQERRRPGRTVKSKKTAKETPRLDFGVCYGAKVDETLIPKFKEIIMEPGHYMNERTGELANVANVASKSSAVPIAYVPLMALNRSNRAHHPAMNAVDKVNGWLRDAQNNVIIQSKGSPNDTYTLDLRHDKTKQAMAAYVSSVVKAGYGGVFFDMIDDVAALETSDPKTYGGSRAAAIEFVQEIFRDLERTQELRAKRKLPPFKIVISGLSGKSPSIRGGDPLEELAPYADIACISQATENGEFRGMKNGARGYTAARLITAITARARFDKDKKRTDNPLVIYPIEPDAPQAVAGLDVAAAVNTPQGKKLINDTLEYFEDIKNTELKRFTKDDFKLQTPYLSFSAPNARYFGLNYYEIEQEPE